MKFYVCLLFAKMSKRKAEIECHALEHIKRAKLVSSVWDLDTIDIVTCTESEARSSLKSLGYIFKKFETWFCYKERKLIFSAKGKFTVYDINEQKMLYSFDIPKGVVCDMQCRYTSHNKLLIVCLTSNPELSGNYYTILDVDTRTLIPLQGPHPKFIKCFLLGTELICMGTDLWLYSYCVLTGEVKNMRGNWGDWGVDSNDNDILHHCTLMHITKMLVLKTYKNKRNYIEIINATNGEIKHCIEENISIRSVNYVECSNSILYINWKQTGTEVVLYSLKDKTRHVICSETEALHKVLGVSSRWALLEHRRRAGDGVRLGLSLVNGMRRTCTALCISLLNFEFLHFIEHEQVLLLRDECTIAIIDTTGMQHRDPRITRMPIEDTDKVYWCNATYVGGGYIVMAVIADIKGGRKQGSFTLIINVRKGCVTRRIDAKDQLVDELDIK
jgi:hypothetical protein